MTNIKRRGIIIFMAAAIAAQSAIAATQVSLITILPGKALYSSFGHTAIRVLDPDAGTDVLYNYGLSEKPFDLTFAARMLVGKMDFTVGVLDTKGEFQFYSQYENRTIIEQKLDLDASQRASLLSALEKNALPENRIYNYRYFTDNCATRVWKIFAALDAQAPDARAPRPTLRQSIGRTLAPRPWLALAIDLMLGPAADARTKPDAPVFLPGELMDWTAGIARAHADGGEKLVGSTQTLYLARPERRRGEGITPLAAAIALVVLAVALGLFLRRDNPASIVFDAILFGAAAIVCLAIALFWLAAGYGEVGWNLNLLWAIPLPLIALILGEKASGAGAARVLFRITSIAAAILAITGGFGLQTISPAIRLVALATAIRCAVRGLSRCTAPGAKLRRMQPRANERTPEQSSEVSFVRQGN